IAHICLETVDNDAGAAFLEEWMTDYDARASFHCHLAWHQAMFELQRGRHARALEVFHRHIVGAVNPRLAMIDGSALLWRFRLAGGPAEPPASRRPARLAGPVSRPGFVFGEIHEAPGLAAWRCSAALAEASRRP